MLFNSLEFLIFFPIVVFIYFIIKKKHRWIFLLFASYYFYMCWKPEYVFLIIISTVIDYFAGLQMGKTNCSKKRKLFLLLSLVSNLGILFGFKYLNFVNESVKALLDQFNIFYGISEFNIILPVGISFYTFQTLSYSIDVYRGARASEKHFGIFALYVVFFPQLVAGPIERSTRLIPQLHKTKDFDYSAVANGFKLILWGLFKKVVIADRLAIYVNSVYNNPYDYSGLPLILSTIFFAFQIYCDFSGYSDIAIGAARILRINLMDNFKQPYFSKSISEFWKRWHISLSTWFKDYLYIPLGGNRVTKWRWYYNLFIVFLVSGLWHGANWTFIIWGAIHGFYLIFSIWSASLRKTIIAFFHINKTPILHKYLKIFITFFLVCFSWIFFRANNLSEAIYIITHLFTDLSNTQMLKYIETGFGFGLHSFIIALSAIIFLEIMEIFQRKNIFIKMLYRKPISIRLAAYSLLIFCIILFGKFSLNQFIYFQF